MISTGERPLDLQCILFGVTVLVGQDFLIHTQRLLWTSDQPSIVFYSVLQLPVSQGLFINTRLLWTCDQSDNRQKSSPRWIRTRDLNRLAATLTDIVFYLVWQLLIGQDFLWTSNQPDIVFYLVWQPLVGQDPLIHTRILWTSDQPANRKSSILRWNSNPRSQ
jgi:hypothetical protein